MGLIGSILILAAMITASNGAAKNPKRVEHRIHGDSTTLMLSVRPLRFIRSGELVTARIHVGIQRDWQIGALPSKANGDYACPMPFRVLLPDSLARYFEIVSLRETGKITSIYDSDFAETWPIHTEPFDVIATLRVREKVKTWGDFRLFAGYQAISKIRQQCFPPCWYEVTLKKPDLVSNEGSPRS